MREACRSIGERYTLAERNHLGGEATIAEKGTLAPREWRGDRGGCGRRKGGVFQEEKG